VVFFRIETLTQLSHDTGMVRAGADLAGSQSNADGAHNDLLQAAPHVDDSLTIVFFGTMATRNSLALTVGQTVSGVETYSNRTGDVPIWGVSL